MASKIATDLRPSSMGQASGAPSRKAPTTSSMMFMGRSGGQVRLPRLAPVVRLVLKVPLPHAPVGQAD